MNDPLAIEYGEWQVDEPPAGFADRVMEAVINTRPEIGVLPLRRATSARKVALLAAAALAVASAGVLAAVGLRSRTQPVESPVASANNSHTGNVLHDDRNGGAAAPPGEARTPVVPPGVKMDRKLRDDVRTRWSRGLEGRGVEVDPHTGLTIPSGARGPSSNLSREYIQARIRQDFYPLAISCYEGALAKRPNLGGRIVVDFMIVGDAKVGGIVDQAKINDRSDIDDDEFKTCLRESMLSMVFEAPENDGWVTVTYPFVFAPSDEGQTDR